MKPLGYRLILGMMALAAIKVSLADGFLGETGPSSKAKQSSVAIGKYRVGHKRGKGNIPLGESQLVGIHLYDRVQKVIELYGPPTEIRSADAPEHQEEVAPLGGTVQGGPEAEHMKEVTYTRLVYKRPSSEYGFIIDPRGRVVQIEAIGPFDPKVHTSKGITLGNELNRVVLAYGWPEPQPKSIEISDTQSMFRYLRKYCVAFRLAKVDGSSKPDKVISIIVSAGNP